jgi:hypothetical protein
MLGSLATTRSPARHHVLFLVSIQAGLRATAMASLRWAMVTDAQGQVAEVRHVPKEASQKGCSQVRRRRRTGAHPGVVWIARVRLGFTSSRTVPGTAPRVVHASVRSPAMPSTLVVMLPVCHAWALHQLQVYAACQLLRLALRCDM